MSWVAFVADGAHLARRSGVDDRPLVGDTAITFSTPAGLTAEVELPNAGTVRGMAIPRGVTLIVGGGYHGKSTLAPGYRTRRIQSLSRRRAGVRGDRSLEQ